MKENLKQLYLISDELRALSNLGIRYSQNTHDSERYERILDLSAKLFSLLDGKNFDEIRNAYMGDMAHASPLSGAEAVVYRDDEVLLIKRHDDGLWALPGGLVEVGETLTEAAVRELSEETGVSSHVTELIGIFDSRRWNSAVKYHMYHFLFLVEADTSQMHRTEEALDIQFFSSQRLPPLSPGHDMRVPFVYDLLSSKEYPYFD